MQIEVQEFKGSPIFFYQDLDDKDMEYLNSKFGITYEMLNYAADDKERARVEYDEIEKTWLLVFHAPVIGKAGETLPISFIAKDNNMFVILRESCLYVTHIFKSLLNNAPNDETPEQVQDMSKWTLLFNVLYQITSRFFDDIEILNKRRNDLEDKSREKMTNEAIYDLSDLSKNLIYILTSINADVIALETYKMLNKRVGDDQLHFTKHEIEHLNDVVVEIKQAQSMAQTSSDITRTLTDSYNNLINNNMNNVMKFLTIYSVILTIPTIVTGFFGMNVKIPGADSPLAWVMTIVIMLGLSYLLWRTFKKRNLM